ncbi:MAG: hypothetical protein RLZZ337_169 [Bacteroidota bacterium]|jgi:predicted nucleic acid-binding Zn ribbon protein
METIKHCLHCGKELLGRADKKFCHQQCRNDYNNVQNGKSNFYIRKVNTILKRNRNILESLAHKDKSIKVLERDLAKEGFSFEYFTNTYTTKAEKTYYFCYEYGYLKLDDGYFALVYNKHHTGE